MNVLVTAGPTRETIDPVRFLSNRSSGKMGFAVAQVAAARGHAVTLIAGPVALATPDGVRRVDVVSAADMLAAVERELQACDALVMAAAVADWTPRTVSAQKLKKGAASMTLELERTADILEAIRPFKGSRVFVGFAAETQAVLTEAHRKLAAKGVDLIVANDVSQPDAGFAVDTNRVVLVAADGSERALPLLAKTQVAEEIVAWMEARAAGSTA